MAKIAIVGAGLAGVQCGQLLTQRGHDIILLEKARGTGGRMTTKRLPWSHVDLGAQYFTAKSPEMKAITNNWLSAGWISEWPFTPFKLCSSGLEPSADDTMRFVATPGMNSLCKNIGKALKLQKATCICDITLEQSGWQLGSESGQTFDNFDWVVSSLPAEQSLQLLKDEDIARHIPMNIHTPCWTLVLGTQGHVAPDIQGIFGDHTVSWVSRQSAKPGRTCHQELNDVWVLHFSSEWSTKHGKYLDLNITELGHQWLEAALDRPLKVIQSYHHFWRYANINHDAPSPPYLCDQTRRIGLIGAWTAGGKVSGAIESAQTFVDHYF